MTGSQAARIVRAVLCPEIAVRHIIKRLSIGSLEFRLALNALDKPEYAYGVQQAIYLASRLNHRRVSVIEFGVGRGRGLKCLEKYAIEMGKAAGIAVDVYGFDMGTGLTCPTDYRDLKYLWREGAFAMDIKRLQSELRVAQLILSNVRETIPAVVRALSAPIGFISFDLDYYTSTRAAFQVFDAPDEMLLPRVPCYFDDVVSDGETLHCDQIGELLAIGEFNQRADHHKIAPAHLLHANANMLFDVPWAQQFWAYHRFQHFEYNTYIGV
jgi:hypothetical protein